MGQYMLNGPILHMHNMYFGTTVDPQERSTWRSGPAARSAMHADSQFPGRGPTDVDEHVNKKSTAHL